MLNLSAYTAPVTLGGKVGQSLNSRSTRLDGLHGPARLMMPHSRMRSVGMRRGFVIALARATSACDVGEVLFLHVRAGSGRVSRRRWTRMRSSVLSFFSGIDACETETQARSVIWAAGNASKVAQVVARYTADTPWTRYHSSQCFSGASGVRQDRGSYSRNASLMPLWGSPI